MTEWKRALAAAVDDLDELLEMLHVDPAELPPLASRSPDFALRVPRDFIRRMRPGDPTDPLLRQVLPLAAEDEPTPGYSTDPLDEPRFLRGPGLLHKYQGRALLLAAAACAVHCRYCFRRHGAVESDLAGRRQALELIAADPTIEEVILSGGDPLSLDDRPLAALLAELAAIPHLRRVRLHTRLPVVIPARVTADLVAALAALPQAVVVIHANHANEVDGEVRAALAPLRRAGVTLLNQAVLLAGVNDNAEAIAALSEAVFAAGVLPYYLHLLDPVAGTAHFDVPEERARVLVAAVRERLPGYLVPRLVREVPGAPAKVVVG
jgi:EF-P beta-lysylation protein EpmB